MRLPRRQHLIAHHAYVLFVSSGPFADLLLDLANQQVDVGVGVRRRHAHEEVAALKRVRRIFVVLRVDKRVLLADSQQRVQEQCEVGRQRRFVDCVGVSPLYENARRADHVVQTFIVGPRTLQLV